MNKREKQVIENKNKKNWKRILSLGLIVVFLVLFLVMVIRLAGNNPIFASGESYYNVRIANSIAQEPLLTQDPVQESVYEPNPYHYFIALVFITLPDGIVNILLPLILGLLSAFVLFKILTLLSMNPKHAAYSLFVLAATPVFIVLFTGLYLSGFFILLSLLAVLLALGKGAISKIIGVILLIILALTSLTGFLITILVLFLLCLYVKRNIKTAFISLILSIIGVVIATIFSNYVPRILGFHSFAFREVFSILRAGFGFDIFLLILFVAGFILAWTLDKKRNMFHLPVLLLVVISFFNSIARVYASIIIVVYCVAAIRYFYNREWHLKIIRAGTLLLILCSLVFSGTNQINTLVDAQPKQEVVEALSSLSPFDNGVVLTDSELGLLVEFYSEKKVMLQSSQSFFKNSPEIIQDSSDLFQEARLVDAEPIIKKHDLRYILITPEMKEELWESQEKGLWFLIINSESFVKKYVENGIEIWEYKEVKQEIEEVEETEETDEVDEARDVL